MLRSVEHEECPAFVSVRQGERVIQEVEVGVCAQHIWVSVDTDELGEPVHPPPGPCAYARECAGDRSARVCAGGDRC